MAGLIKSTIYEAPIFKKSLQVILVGSAGTRLCPAGRHVVSSRLASPSGIGPYDRAFSCVKKMTDVKILTLYTCVVSKL